MWYYYQNGQQVGPVPVDTIRGLAAQGQLRADDLVWREGMPQWSPLRQVPELSGGLPPSGHAATGPAAQPQAPIGYYTPTQTAQYASVWLRFCAMIVDGLIAGVLGLLVGAVFGGIFGFMVAVSGGDIDAFSTALEIGGNLIGLLISWIYEASFESSSKQATLGKMAVGIFVTDEAGQRISFARATGRHFGKYLSGIILLIGYIMAIFTARKQALHDIMAGTLVLKRAT